MMQSTNTPYVRQYDKDGIFIPLKTNYLSTGNNRSQRREVKQKKRFFGNGKNLPLSVGKAYRYLRSLQIVGPKKIEHYLMCK